MKRNSLSSEEATLDHLLFNSAVR